MASKKMIQRLKQNMPRGLNEIETIRYIYIFLGKEKAFDTQYFYGNKKAKRKIVRLAHMTKENIEATENKKNITCISLSYLFQDILKSFGINCSIVEDEYYGDGHVMIIINLSDGSSIKTDLQQDLQNIQAGLCTEHFATEYKSYRFNIISQDELKEIDKKIGYIKKDYRNQDVENLKSQMQGMNVHQALEYILLNPVVYEGVEMQGQIERRKYYKAIFEKVLNPYKQQRIYTVVCFREKENQVRDYSLCVYSYENNEIRPYVYSEKEERFVPVSIQKLIELQEEGLKINPNKKGEGVNLLKKYIENYKKRQNQKDDDLSAR